MSKYFFGGSGQDHSRGLISEKPFVVKFKADGKFKGYESLQEARSAARTEGDIILFYHDGNWHEVHCIAS